MRNRRQNSLNVLLSFCQRDIKHNIVFQCRKIIFWLLTAIVNVFNQSSKKCYVKYGKYTDLKKYFSENNIWLCSQVFRVTTVQKRPRKKPVLSNVIG